MITREQILKTAQEHDSFYLYDESMILKQIQTLREHFRDVSFLYSVKCNPNPEILQTIAGQGLGADAASAQEVLASLKAGIKSEDIYYSAPGKSSRDIEQTLGKCILVADSVGEVERILEETRKKKETVGIGVRIHPNFSFDQENAAPSKFGIDEEQFFSHLPKWKEDKIRICGIHVHLRSQDLDTDRIARYHQNVLKLAEKVQKELGYELDFINLGAGIGIPYGIEDREVDIRKLAEQFELFKKNVSVKNARMLIETGRYLVGNSGFYGMKVLDKKVSRTKTYVILSSTLNGFMRPSLARLVEKYAKEEYPAGTEPLFTKTDAFQFTVYTQEEQEEEERVDLVGNLCTAADVIAEDILLPRLQPGDLVVVNHAGSYAATLSPFAFASLGRPAEILIHAGTM